MTHFPPSLPAYDADAVRLLNERTEYEASFLEAVYTLVDDALFPSYPDAVIYPIASSSQPLITSYMRGSIVIGDWRPGFLNAGAPLILIMTFKLLDMFIEWVLKENGFSVKFQFGDKIKKLKNAPIFPEPIESRPWLKERLESLYCHLEPLRGTIIHNKEFAAAHGSVQVSSSRGEPIGPPVQIGAATLRTLALTVVSVLRYVDGTWSLDKYREKMLRYQLDELASIHQEPTLGQRQPFFTTVREFSVDADPRSVNPAVIRNDLAGRYPNQDCMFDLRVLTVKNGGVVNAFLFPWALLETGGSEWGNGINPKTYSTPIPNDMDPRHYEGRDTH